MFRPQLMAWLLLTGVVPASECRIASGPDGLCAAVRFDPRRADLHVGSTLRVRVNGLDCAGSPTCVDCTNRRRRVQWHSSAPDVVSVDSTGQLLAKRAGAAEIRLEVDEVSTEPMTTMRIVVSP
jgi:hypothetical protein